MNVKQITGKVLEFGLEHFDDIANLLDAATKSGNKKKALERATIAIAAKEAIDAMADAKIKKLKKG